jgi:hypothetical protein
MVGSSSASSSRSDQWVVAGRPASSPAAAYTSAPVQTLVSRGTVARWRRTQSRCVEEHDPDLPLRCCGHWALSGTPAVAPIDRSAFPTFDRFLHSAWS